MKKIKSRNLRLRIQENFKKCLVLLGVFVIFYCSSYVNAGMNDSVIEKKRIDSVYAVATIDNKERIFYLNIYELNGRVAYCIDLGVDITTSIYHSTNDFLVSYLSNEQIEYIRSISYFGFGYEGHDDYKYYMAAQELIWEYLSDTEVEWSCELGMDGPRINIDFYKDKILELRNLYNKELNFEWFDEQTFAINDKIVLTDNNNILFDYEVVSSKYSDVSIDGDKLIIKVGNVIDEEQIELRKKKYYDYDSSLYYYDNSQRLISNGNYKEIRENLIFNISGITLNVQVLDKDLGINSSSGEASLEGAIYELYNEVGDLIGNYKTDDKGFFKVDNLPSGNYYIKQIKASEGYLINEEKIYFELSKENNELILKQQVITNNIEIRKVYGSNGSYKPEKNILFLIYDSKGTIVKRVTTNVYGRISVELAYGTYKVVQNNTKPGYSKVDDFIIEVKEYKNNKVYYKLVNELIMAKVKVMSIEKESNELLDLDGFSYRIRKRDENTYIELDGNDIFAADNNGELLIPVFLGYGDYVLEQVSVPNGFMLNEEEKHFSINDDSELSLIGDALVMEVNFYNELVMGRVNVLALEEKFYSNFNEYGYEMMKRVGNNFTLIANEDIIVNKKIIYKIGQEVYKDVTDIDGKLIIDNLYLGNYCLVDNMINEKQCFKLSSIDNKTGVVDVSLEFIKKMPKVNIIIQNVSNTGKYIYNSVFEVLDNNGNIIYTGVTNDDGIIKLGDILIGNYCIKQKDISLEYQMLEEEKCVFIDEDKKIEIVNNLVIRETVDVPDTLSEGIGLYDVILILFLIGTIIFVYKKIFVGKLYR